MTLDPKKLGDAIAEIKRGLKRAGVKPEVIDIGAPYDCAELALMGYGVPELEARAARADELERELADVKADYLRRHKDACDRFEEIAALKAELTQTREERSAAIKELGEYARKCGRLEVDLERFQWRPIEEAPKDGKTKLLFGATWMKSFNDCVEDALHFVECEWWEETSKNTKKRRTERRLYLVEHQFECSYTHFMPIPTPPAEANHG